jgi:hypothetical protein
MEDRFAHMNKRTPAQNGTAAIQKTRMTQERFELLYGCKLVGQDGPDAPSLLEAKEAFERLKNKVVTRIILDKKEVEIWFRNPS